MAVCALAPSVGQSRVETSGKLYGRRVDLNYDVSSLEMFLSVSFKLPRSKPIIW